MTEQHQQTGSDPSLTPTVPMGGMGRSGDEGQYTTPLQIIIPHVFQDLLTPKRYKVYLGGRGGAKSFAFADTLLIMGMQRKLRILCARELQVSINDSVHKLLSDEISRYKLDGFYTVQQATIKGANGTEFMFKGLRHNANEIKSTEGVDICWCFPAGTLVDGRPIEILRRGDEVKSFNHAKSRIEMRPITCVIKNSRPDTMINILTSNGCRPILCTPEHPIFVKGKGYVPAMQIESGDIVYAEEIESTKIGTMLGWLWRNDRNKLKRSSCFIRKAGWDLLQRLREVVVNKKPDREQPDEQSCVPIKDYRGQKESAQERGRWKWAWNDKGAKRIIGEAWAWMVAGAGCSNQKVSGGTDELQAGFGECVLHALHRMRWKWAPRANGPGGGRKKKYVLAERRVDCVEVYKQKDIERNKRSDGGNYVYNIEVEGNNNYFAEGVLVHNCEEAQKVSDNSWELLIPTIRKEGSEIWMSFNPKKPSDATYKRFVMNAPVDSIVKKVSWRDNPFFPDVLNRERLHLEKTDPAAYAHIWEGEFDTRFDGSVYARFIEALRAGGQITDRVEYDEKFPVYTSWDLGWTDATAVWFFQVGVGEIFVIDYWEATGKDVKSCMEILYGREIVVSHVDPITKREQWNFGAVKAGHDHRKDWIYAKHYVPHDALNKIQAAGGRSIIEQAGNFGVKMDCIPATSTLNGIQALRATLPRCWIAKGKCADLIEAMLEYHYEYDEHRESFKDTPYHNWSSHCAKAGELMARVWREKAVTVTDMARVQREAKWKRLRSEAKMDNMDPYRTKKPVRKK